MRQSKRLHRQLLESGAASEAELDAILAEEQKAVKEAIEFARAAAAPGPEELYIDVFADPACIPDGSGGELKPTRTGLPKGETKQMTFCEAINHTLDLALTSDPRVLNT